MLLDQRWMFNDTRYVFYVLIKVYKDRNVIVSTFFHIKFFTLDHLFLQLFSIYIIFGIKYHDHVALVARISLTLSRHPSLSFIALGRCSGQHPVSSHSCWMYVRAGCPAFARPCVGVHKSTSLMSSSLLLQQCPACLVRLTWIVFCDRRQVAVQLVSCGMLPPGLVQDCTQHSCVIAV